MKFYLQMGYGMKTMSEDLSRNWQGATVILSPRDIYPTEKLAPYASALRKSNGRVLFDPQLYSPRKYHKNLKKHSYWTKTEVTNFEVGECYELISVLASINAELESEAFILPTSIIDKIDERWNKVQAAIADQARKVAGGQRLMQTIALGKNILIDDSQTESVVNYVNQWDVDGVYIVCERPERYYLVDNSIWMANLLALVAGIKRQGKAVIVGYANHQMLPLALAKCDAIAAGNFLNVRRFQPEHFETLENSEPSRRSTWYYCPQALSEYKLTYLDVEKRAGVLSTMAPPPAMRNEYSDVLFKDATPSSTNYKEGNSFRHYLHCLKIQCANASKASYKETRDAQFAQLETAARIIDGLLAERIKGQERDFSEIIDVNEAAIQIFDKEYGFPMSQEWDEL